MSLNQRGTVRPLSDLLAVVGTDAGNQRLAEHLARQPFPRYAPHPDENGLFIRTNAIGTVTVGRFLKRKFVPIS
jgi:hypothetical protein